MFRKCQYKIFKEDCHLERCAVQLVEGYRRFRGACSLHYQDYEEAYSGQSCSIRGGEKIPALPTTEPRSSTTQPCIYRLGHPGLSGQDCLIETIMEADVHLRNILKIRFLPHRKHKTSKLQSSNGKCCWRKLLLFGVRTL
jgi:hypothetical protein